jgi:hypothetical protein
MITYHGIASIMMGMLQHSPEAPPDPNQIALIIQPPQDPTKKMCNKETITNLQISTPSHQIAPISL